MTTRRKFVGTIGASTAGLFTTNLWPQVSATTARANDKIGVGVIGVGAMGFAHLQWLLGRSDVRVISICDVYSVMTQRAVARAQKDRKPIGEHDDFRELLADKNIDAVFIATPDHWHALMTIEACKRGKDVYVEKPASHTVLEYLKIVEAANKHSRVVDVGTQQPSWPHFQKAIAIAKSGLLGVPLVAETHLNGGALFEDIGSPADSNPPPGLNWDMWLGPAPWRPYNENRHGIEHRNGTPFKNKDGDFFRWATWRLFYDYGGGMVDDWEVHLRDIALRMFDLKGPVSVSAFGRKLFVKDNRETPDTMKVSYDFGKMLGTFENNSGNLGGEEERENQDRPGRRSHGITIRGTKATLEVNRQYYKLTAEPGNKLPVDPPIPLKGKYEDDGEAHHIDFLNCLRTRQSPVADIRKHFASLTTNLANLAYRTGRVVGWNPNAQTLTTSELNTEQLHYEYRSPWKLEV